MSTVQVLETSQAISETFRLQQEAGATLAIGQQLSGEVAELEAILSRQRENRATCAKTDAAKLQEAAQFYRGLENALSELFEFNPARA